MKLSPQTEMRRDAISVFFTLVNVNVKMDMALALLNHFVSRNHIAVDQVKFRMQQIVLCISYFIPSSTQISHFRIQYLVNNPVEIIAGSEIFRVFSGMSKMEIEAKHSVRHFVEQIIQLLMKSVTTEQKEQFISWLVDLCSKETMQNISCLICQETENIATLCFLYNILFSTIVEGNSENLDTQVSMYILTLKFVFFNDFIEIDQAMSSILKH